MAMENQQMGKHANPIQVEKFLKGMDYPASKEDLLKKAEQQGADDNVLETLKMIPDQIYNSPKDLSRAIGNLE